MLKSVLSIMRAPRPVQNLEKYLSSVLEPPEENFKIPLNLLFIKLNAAGIETDPATVLDIQKVLATRELVPKNLGDLHIIIRALICKNVGQQAIFDFVFSEFLAEVKLAAKNRHRIDSLTIQEIIDCYKKDRKQFMIIRFAAILVFTAIALGSIWLVVSSANKPPEITIRDPVRIWPEDSTRSYFVVGDSVALSYTLSEKLKNDQRVKWAVGYDKDSTSLNGQAVRLDRPETLQVTVAILDDAGRSISADTIMIESVCEKTPGVEIVKRKGNALGERFVYGSKLWNASNDSARYRYVWLVNERIVSHSSTFDTIFVDPSDHTIGLRVEFDQGVHCSTDHLEDLLTESVGGISISVSGDMPVEFISETKFSLALPIALFFVTVLAGVYFLILRVFKRRSPSAYTPDTDEASDEYPLTIQFKKQDAGIKVDKSLAEMVANFSKRQRSEELELDIVQTIKRTCRSAGFPFLSYREKIKKEGFVFLIDTSIVKGQRKKALDFLSNFLCRNQVEVTTFAYHRHPLFLYGSDPNLPAVSLAHLTRDHSESNLVLFTSADNFFSPETLAPYDWAVTIARRWQRRTLVTSSSGRYWDIKEARLEKLGFKIASDMDSLSKSLLQQTETNSIGNSTPRTYPSTIDFDDIDALELFLKDDYMKQWVFSLAIYPKIDWELTVALGRNISKLYPEIPMLATYDNLYKLSQISWLNDGLVSDALRAEMLRRLTNDVHKVARQTLQELLIEIGPDINEHSVVKNEFEIFSEINGFFLKGLENDRGYLKKHYRRIEYLRRSGDLDAAIDKSLTQSISTFKNVCRDIKWYSFPYGYLSRILIPVLTSAIFMSLFLSSPSVKDLFLDVASDTVKFVIDDRRPNDSNPEQAELSVYFQTRSLRPDSSDGNTRFVTGLSPEEINRAVITLWLNGEDSIEQVISPLAKINYLTLEDFDDNDRYPVTVYYNDPKNSAGANSLLDTLASLPDFRIRQQLQLMDTIRQTRIVAPDAVARRLARIASNVSGATGPYSISPYVTDKGAIETPGETEIFVYLDYEEEFPPPPPIKGVTIFAESGLEFREYWIDLGGSSIVLYAAIIEPSYYTANIAGISREVQGGVVPIELIERQPSAKVLLGSGFVESFQPLVPNGFLKIDARVVSPVKRLGYNGIVGIVNNTLTLMPAQGDISRLNAGFQTGPFLVRGGRNVYNKQLSSANDLYERAFVGINQAGKIIAGITKGSVSLKALSDILSTTNDKDLRCTTALNLSGGGSEVLIVRSDKGELLRYGSYDYYHSAVIIFNKNAGGKMKPDLYKK